METYKLTILERTGWITKKETSDTSILEQYRKEAHDWAVKCLPWANIEDKFTHLVYYYEIGTEVDIRFIPTACTDADLDLFIQEWQPAFVGALHRR